MNGHSEYDFLKQVDQSKWQTEIELDKNRYTIKFNKLTEQQDILPEDRPIKGEVQGVEYDQAIVMDQ